jgi:protein-tyrosine phosphatase
MTSPTNVTRVCFVCLGNICRSPTAEGVFRHVVLRAGLGSAFVIDSAGTGDWHVGEAPDERAVAAAARRGIPLESRARQFVRADFARFDLVVAMDKKNREVLRRMAGSEAATLAKIHLLRTFDPESPPHADVPDPYYGGDEGFEEVLDICEDACLALLAHLRAGRV